MTAAQAFRRVTQELNRPISWPGEQKLRLLPKSFFLEYAHREYLRGVRSDSPPFIVVLSLKEVTDSATVDLYNLSKTIQPLIRETDVIGWYGDKAIAILLADTDKNGMTECVQRILSQTGIASLSLMVRSYPELAANIPSRRDPDLAESEDGAIPFFRRMPRTAVALKRCLDVFGSLIGILLFSPIMLFAALAIKATSPGPIIFKQVRVGRGGVPFLFFKFRSMRTGASEDAHRTYVQSLIKGDTTHVNQGDKGKPLYKMKNDLRITPVGAFLRKSSMDELPQFFNVLRGDMSLVGPRPPIPYEVEAYSSWHLRRILEVKPGITGLWQVEGRSVVSFDDMVRLDLRYAQHWSIWLDIKILLKTAKVVFQRVGAV